MHVHVTTAYIFVDHERVHVVFVKIRVRIERRRYVLVEVGGEYMIDTR